jgi:choline kinase
MKIFILAAGKAERWNGAVKQLAPIGNETVIDRTIRMLKDNDVSVLTRNEHMLNWEMQHMILRPENNDTILNTVLSSRDEWDDDETIFLMGDVVWTQDALDKVLEPIDKSCQFYGSWDEHFAFRFKREFYEHGQIEELGTTWQLYRSICGIPLHRHWTETWFRTLIDDKTDDIDYPEDYQQKLESGYFKDM